MAIESNPEPIADQAAGAALKCPACDNLFQNVSLQVGQALRCLNCGHRFVPIPAPAQTEKPSNEPVTPGYWMIRIPAAILLVFSIVITAIIIYSWLSWSALGTNTLAEIAYMLLIPTVGVSLFLFSQALARIDELGCKAIWRAGKLGDGIGRKPGSSLPYIAPLAVGGGLLPVVIVAGQSNVEAGLIFAGVLGGAAMFLLGFAFEDVALFLWRQRQLAKRCATNPVPGPRPVVSPINIIFVFAILMLIALLISGIVDARKNLARTVASLATGGKPKYGGAEYMLEIYWRQIVTCSYVAILLFFAGCSLLFLFHGLIAAAAEWRDVASRKNTQVITARLFWIAPFVWAGFGLIYLVDQYNRSPYYLNDVVIMAALGGLILCLALVFRYIVLWRKDYEKVWSRGNVAPAALLPKFYGVFMTVYPIVLVLMFVSRSFYYSNGFEFLLGTFMAHYPILCIGGCVYQVLSVEALLRSVSPAKSQ